MTFGKALAWDQIGPNANFYILAQGPQRAPTRNSPSRATWPRGERTRVRRLQHKSSSQHRLGHTNKCNTEAVATRHSHAHTQARVLSHQLFPPTLAPPPRSAHAPTAHALFPAYAPLNPSLSLNAHDTHPTPTPFVFLFFRTHGIMGVMGLGAAMPRGAPQTDSDGCAGVVGAFFEGFLAFRK